MCVCVRVCVHVRACVCSCARVEGGNGQKAHAKAHAKSLLKESNRMSHI